MDAFLRKDWRWSKVLCRISIGRIFPKDKRREFWRLVLTGAQNWKGFYRDGFVLVVVSLTTVGGVCAESNDNVENRSYFRGSSPFVLSLECFINLFIAIY